MNPGSDWWHQAFRAAYLEVYHHRDARQAEAEVAGLLPRLRQAPGPVVDAGCGAGRHLVALRAAGISAVGFDLSGDLLGVAHGHSALTGRLARGDLRAPPFATGCGAILCLFTGFGYFDDAGNQACLHALGSLLAPGGILVLDLPDPRCVQRDLQVSSRRTTPNGWLVEETRRINGQRIVKAVIATPPGAGAMPMTWQEDVRLYTPQEIPVMAQTAGLLVQDIWPGLRGPHSQEGRQVAWLAPLPERSLLALT